MADEKGLTYVPQILSEHKAAVESSQGSYEHAVKCGQLLNDAKETVRRGWTAFCEKHLAHIPQTTRSLYMRLAKPENQDKINERITELSKLGEEGKLSIRAAARLLPSQSRKSQAQKETDKANRTKQTVEKYIEEMGADDLAELILKVHEDDDYLNVLVDFIRPQAKEAKAA